MLHQSKSEMLVLRSLVVYHPLHNISSMKDNERFGDHILFSFVVTSIIDKLCIRVIANSLREIAICQLSVVGQSISKRF